MSAQPLGVTSVDLDAFLAADSATVVAYAEAEVRAYCGWHIAPSVTETVEVEGPGARSFRVPSLYLTNVTAITQDSIAEDLTDVTWTTWGQIKHPTSWGVDPIEATITHGYDTVPEDVKAVVLALAARMQSSPDGIFERQVGQIAYQLPKEDGGLTLSGSEKARLARYRLPGVA